VFSCPFFFGFSPLTSRISIRRPREKRAPLDVFSERVRADSLAGRFFAAGRGLAFYFSPPPASFHLPVAVPFGTPNSRGHLFSSGYPRR